MIPTLGEIHKRLSPMADIKAIAEELVAFTGTEVHLLHKQLWHDYGILPNISGCVGGHVCHDRLPLTKKQKQNRKARRKAQRNSRRKNR